MPKNIYKEFCEGGGFTLPFLLHIYDNKSHLYLINDNQDLIYDGVTYKASNFTYTPSINADTILNIEIVNTNGIIDILENNNSFNVEAVGVLYGNEISKITMYKNNYGNATWNGRSLEIKLNRDDRGDMTFPALIFNAYNNRGNS